MKIPATAGIFTFSERCAGQACRALQAVACELVVPFWSHRLPPRHPEVPAKAALIVRAGHGCVGDRAALRGGVGIPESTCSGGLSRDESRFHGLVEVVAPDAPFLTELVGGQLAPQDPVADRLLFELQARGDLFHLEVFGSSAAGVGVMVVPGLTVHQPSVCTRVWVLAPA